MIFSRDASSAALVLGHLIKYLVMITITFAPRRENQVNTVFKEKSEHT